MTHTHTHTHSLSLSFSLSLSLTHTHTQSYTDAHTHTHSHIASVHSHTHTHTHTHTRTCYKHTYSLYHALMHSVHERKRLACVCIKYFKLSKRYFWTPGTCERYNISLVVVYTVLLANCFNLLYCFPVCILVFAMNAILSVFHNISCLPNHQRSHREPFWSSWLRGRQK